MGPALVSNPSPCCPPRCSLLGLASHCLDSCRARCSRCHPLEPQKPEEAFLLAANLDQGRTWQTQQHRTLLWARVSLLSSATPPSVRLVRVCLTSPASHTP